MTSPTEATGTGDADRFPALVASWAATDTAHTRTDQLDSIEWTRRAWEQQNGPQPDYFAAMAAVLRLEQIMGATIDRTLREHGLNRTGYHILTLLYLQYDHSLTMGQLSKRLLIHPTTASLVADKLQARHLVARVSSTTDRRAVVASLTDDGTQALRAVSERLAAVNYGLDGVEPRMAITLTETLRHIRRAMRST